MLLRSQQCMQDDLRSKVPMRHRAVCMCACAACVDIFSAGLYLASRGACTKRLNRVCVCGGAQEASKGERASGRIMAMSRQMMEECRASKNLDERSIAVRHSAEDALTALRMSG